MGAIRQCDGADVFTSAGNVRIVGCGTGVGERFTADQAAQGYSTSQAACAVVGFAG